MQFTQAPSLGITGKKRYKSITSTRERRVSRETGGDEDDNEDNGDDDNYNRNTTTTIIIETQQQQQDGYLQPGTVLSTLHGFTQDREGRKMRRIRGKE